MVRAPLADAATGVYVGKKELAQWMGAHDLLLAALRQLDAKRLAAQPPATLGSNSQSAPSIQEEFEEILEESMENPKTEVIEKTEVMTPFKAYLSAFLPKNSTDYLVLTAKFLADNENLHNFSLKQLNAKLVPAIGMPIDHNAVNEAIEAGVLAEVPNYTDVSDVKEYTLTEAGENYAVEQ